MLAFSKFLQTAGEEEEDYGKQVESYIQRINESVLLPDRRDALFQLRDLLVDNTKAQLAFGSHGLPSMCTVLREHRSEVYMVQAALEAIGHATTQDNRRSAQDAQVGAVNAEQLARTPDSVTLLLSLLDNEVGVQDFYVRYHSLQILKSLLAANKTTLQQIIMGFPLGVSRLITMLEEQEVIRNEALLLLTHLATDNAEIQKLLAFDGAFDKLFAIIREEGGLSGGIVVHDCMALLAALLSGSGPNQLMFRELGYASEVPSLLQLTQPSLSPPAGPHEEQEEMSEDKLANLLAVLRVIEVMFRGVPGEEQVQQQQKGKSSTRQQNIGVLLQHGALPSLVALALNLDFMPNSDIRAQALVCLSLLACDQANRDMLGSAIATVRSGDSRPLLHAVVRAAINGDTHSEHQAADRLIAAMCNGNSGLQFSIANSLTLAAGMNTFGNDVINGVLRTGSDAEMLASSRAASVLSHIVNSNQEVKQRLLTLALSQGQAPGGGGVLAVCARHLGIAITQFGGHRHGPQMVINFGALLVLWLHNFPSAVEVFLESVRQSPFLVGAILSDKQFGPGGPVIRGMCALLLGIVTKYVPPGAPTPKEALEAAVKQQIKLDTFRQLLHGLLQQFTGSLRPPNAGSPSMSRSLTNRLQEIVKEIESEFGIAPPSPVTSNSNNGLNNGQLQQQQQQEQQQTVPAYVNSQSPGTKSSYQPPPPPPTFNPGAGSNPINAIPVISNAAPPTHFQPQASAASTTNTMSASSATTTSSLLPPPMGQQQTQSVHLPNGNQQPAAVFKPSSPPKHQLPTTSLNPPATAMSFETQRQPPFAAGAPNGSPTQQQQQHQYTQIDTKNAQLVSNLQSENAKLAAEVQELQKQLAQARQAASTAQSTANRLEAELEGLSTAYADLDAYANETQAMLQLLKDERAAAPLSENRNNGAAAQGSGLPEDVEQRIAEAVQEAREDGDAAMEDLLICLGQEEAKVAALCERLQQVGIDPEEVLQDFMGDANDDSE